MLNFHALCLLLLSSQLATAIKQLEPLEAIHHYFKLENLYRSYYTAPDNQKDDILRIFEKLREQCDESKLIYSGHDAWVFDRVGATSRALSAMIKYPSYFADQKIKPFFQGSTTELLHIYALLHHPNEEDKNTKEGKYKGAKNALERLARKILQSAKFDIEVHLRDAIALFEPIEKFTEKFTEKSAVFTKAKVFWQNLKDQMKQLQNALVVESNACDATRATQLFEPIVETEPYFRYLNDPTHCGYMKEFDFVAAAVAEMHDRSDPGEIAEIIGNSGKIAKIFEDFESRYNIRKFVEFKREYHEKAERQLSQTRSAISQQKRTYRRAGGKLSRTRKDKTAGQQLSPTRKDKTAGQQLSPTRKGDKRSGSASHSVGAKIH